MYADEEEYLVVVENLLFCCWSILICHKHLNAFTFCFTRSLALTISLLIVCRKEIKERRGDLIRLGFRGGQRAGRFIGTTTGIKFYLKKGNRK